MKSNAQCIGYRVRRLRFGLEVWVSVSIQGLSITFDANGQDDESKERDLPKLERDIDDAVPFQKNASNDAEKMSQGENFADHLSPTRHAAKGKHETGEQDRWKEDKESHLNGLQLVFRDGGEGDSHRQVRNDEDQCDQQ